MNFIGIRSTLLRGLCGLCFYAFSALAQPTLGPRPIKVVVPVAVGGGADQVARLVGDKMSRSLGVPIVVDNRPGGSGSIAALEVARAAPDGHTLMECFVATHSTNPAVLPIKYDPIADFTPVGMIARTSNVLVVGPKNNIQTFAEFLQAAKAQGGAMSYSSAGAGSATHLIMAYLENQAKVSLVHAAYKGAAPAIQDLLSGQVDAMFPSLTTALPHIKAGKLRPLAVASAQRDPVIPNVPTVAELGFPGFSAIQWWGLCAPAHTPEPIVKQLNGALTQALSLPDVQRKLHDMSAEPTPISAPEFGDFLKAEVAKWKKLVQDAKLSVQP
jgi:tripartite-type tricarboxylate transporter receptor subunit TctC